MPTRTGYLFSGWKTSSGNVVTETAQNTTIGNHTLTAVWTPNTIKITLNKNGGSGGTDSFYYKYGINKFYSNESCTTEIASITKPSRTGYTFVHYYGDGSCGGNNGERYVAYDSTNFASDLCTDIYQSATLYASWTPKTYTVTYNANGGSGAAVTDTVTYGTAYKARSNTMFSRTGYSFAGWNENSSGTGSDWTSWIRKDWTWTYDKSITLYAKWTAIQTSISANSTLISFYTYYLDNGEIRYDGSGSITITAGGGGGKWTYSIISSSKGVYSGTPGAGKEYSFYGNEPTKCVSISNAGQTSSSISVTCTGKSGMTYEGVNSQDRPTGVRTFSIYYQYTIRATSVYNGTYADITIKFISLTGTGNLGD